jgi:hypothetical protein
MKQLIEDLIRARDTIMDARRKVGSGSVVGEFLSHAAKHLERQERAAFRSLLGKPAKPLSPTPYDAAMVDFTASTLRDAPLGAKEVVVKMEDFFTFIGASAHHAATAIAFRSAGWRCARRFLPNDRGTRTRLRVWIHKPTRPQEDREDRDRDRPSSTN